MTGQDKASNDVAIGFLTSFRHKWGPAKLYAGALPLAVDHVNARKDLLPKHTLKFYVNDTKEPNTAMAIRSMTEMRDKGVTVFIGPDHSCASEALVAAAWRLPMIAFKCTDVKVSDKKIYTTFARTLPPSSKVTKSLVALLLKYLWKKIVLIVARDAFNLLVEQAFVELASRNNITITKTYYLPHYYLTSDIKNLTGIIDDSYVTNRIYVLLADNDAMIDAARYIHERKLQEKGEYILISFEEKILHPSDYCIKITEHENKPYNFDYCQSVLMITPTYPISLNWNEFEDKILEYSGRPPFSIPYHKNVRVKVPIHAAMLYDAVIIYAQAATKVLEKNLSLYDGEAILENICCSTYDSVLGFKVRIDENGDAEGNYSLYASEPNASSPNMKHLGTFIYQETNGLPSLNLVSEVPWLNGKQPVDEPECGFFNERCGLTNWKLILICSVCVIVLITVTSYAFRHYRYEHKLACLLWKIDMKDVALLKAKPDSTFQSFKGGANGYEGNRFSASADSPAKDTVSGRTLRKLGQYRGNVVYIKPVYKKSIDLTRSLRKEMIRIREMRHENINPFIGACVDLPNICILSLFCARGSLKDILRNSDINLETMFVASLVSDLIKGMTYIHESEIVSHGNLKSTNCLVDSRWVLQITDFGLHEFKAGQELPQSEQKKHFKDQLYTSPELLRAILPISRGSQKGDVYSFGIILHEIIGRKGPWCPTIMAPKDIVERVINPLINGGKLLRPPCEDLDCPENVVRCMEECWHEDPDQRPEFRLMSNKLREMLLEVKTNIFDNMIAIMEKYASNLEGLVEERTHLLMEEKKKTENLLHQMLPKTVADQLKRGEKVEPESFDSVTIYFSDIVGFTALSAVSTPLQVVDLLNDLYTCFDYIIGNFDVYKVETIGDAYMVVSGLPLRNGDKHAAEVALMALRLLGALSTFEIKHHPGARLKLRIGLHSGPCVAGVVGHKMPRYCLFGDTVNTASRMESTGEALKIHVSSSCKNILEKFGEFELEERGLTHVKGKGEMRTYWLIGTKLDSTSPNETESPSPIGSQLHKYTDSRHQLHSAEFKSLNFDMDVATVQRTDSKQYLKEDLRLNGVRKSTIVTTGHVMYSSCRSLLHECKRNLCELRKNGLPLDAGYRSTPSISQRQFETSDAIG